MTRVLLVFVAGGIGSVLRYLVVNAGARVLGASFPWGVLGVNVAGSFLIALVMVFAASRADFSETTRITLTAGFLGGLTTYSSFNQDTLSMLDRKLYGTAGLYVVATLATCLVAGAIGAVAARRM